MKILIFLLCISFSNMTWAQKTGAGVMLGNPTGIIAKHWLSESTAVDAAAGMSFGKHSNFSMHSDFLWHSEGALFLNDVHPLDLYYGLGGRMEFADDIELGLRLPIGLVHRQENQLSDMFLEVAPILDFITTTGVEVHLLFGARYYFQ